MRIVAWLDALVGDLRYAVRGLRRSPGLVIVSALSLGLGIGLNASLFTGISNIWRHAPTIASPDGVVAIEPGSRNQFSYLDYDDLRRSRIFADVAGLRVTALSSGSVGRQRRVAATAVTANFFEALGINAHLGRVFTAQEAALEQEPRLAVVTAGFWRRELGGSPAAIGSTLMLNREPFSIVGVLGDDYRAVTGWIAPAIYVPLSRLTLPAVAERGAPTLNVLARLRPGTTARQAASSLAAFVTSLERAYPDRLESGGRPVHVFPATELQFRGAQDRYRLLMLAAAVTVALVLLIACLNVAGLLTARAVQRRREIAIRIALGAGHARVLRTLFAESFALVALGAAVGLPLAFALTVVPYPDTLAPLRQMMTPDSRMLPYASALIVITTLICGALPAWRATRADVASEIRQSGSGATPRLGMRHALVVAQMAMSLVLVVAALLCVRSQQQISRMDYGFDLNSGVVARFGLDEGQYPGQERARLATMLLEALAPIPGVTAASVADLVPLGGDSLVRSFHPAGRTDLPGTRPSTFSVGAGFFRTLGIRVQRGREFTPADRDGASAVAIVNDTFARTHFPGEEAIGQSVQTADEVEATVVGVVQDHRIGTIGETPQSVIYYPFAQRPSDLTLHVRTATPPEAAIADVEQAIARVDPTLPVEVQTLRRATSLELSMRQVATLLMGTLGAVGLLLALVGLYGVMSYVVNARTAEVGIRMTLGASRSRILRETLQRTLNVLATGVGLGAIGALATMPALSTFLAGVSPFDPLAFGAAAALLMVVGLGAGYAPARRSARLDPVQALRQL